MDYRRKDKNMGKEICKEIISVIWVKRRVVWISWWQWNWRELGRIRIHFESTINQFSSVQSLSHVWLFLTPWTAVHQASPSITNSWSLLKLMSIESIMPFKRLILCHPLLLPPSIIASIRAFSVIHKFGLRSREVRYLGVSFQYHDKAFLTTKSHLVKLPKWWER